eukprot:scaffold11493_cov31-Tisochrysis_lutea.AAC.1
MDTNAILLPLHATWIQVAGATRSRDHDDLGLCVCILHERCLLSAFRHGLCWPGTSGLACRSMHFHLYCRGVRVLIV